MSNFAAFIILFGVLVFFHELGHFLAAKYFRIGVERFALGFGPKLFGKKIGETEYLVAAIPLGGYVKMVGDEPSDEKAAEADDRPLPENGFLAKPAWQRIVVVLMGPIANFLLPIALFFILYMVGQPALGPEIGYVARQSVALQAGLQPGDLITEIDGQPVKQWDEITKLIADRAGKNSTLTIQRPWLTEKNTFKINLIPVLDEDRNLFGEPIKIGRIGVNPSSFRLLVHIADLKSMAYSKGVRSGDELVEVNNRPVRFAWQIEDLLAHATSNVVTMTFVRDQGGRFAVELPRSLVVDKRGKLQLDSIGLHFTELVIDQVLPGSIAQEKGLKAGDILHRMDGASITSWFNFQEAIRNSTQPIRLTLLRDGQAMELEISPRMHEQREEITGEKTKQRLLGITSLGEASRANLVIEKITNPFKALSLSVQRCYQLVELTIVSFVKLLSGQVSAKSLGGPILIYQLAGKSWESGMHAFINMIVMISISLGIFNLLPVPVLDGGHLMFYTIEMIKGSPLRRRTRELAQQIGVALVITLMLFAFYNDLSRIAWSELKWVRAIFGH